MRNHTMAFTLMGRIIEARVRGEECRVLLVPEAERDELIAELRAGLLQHRDDVDAADDIRLLRVLIVAWNVGP